MSKSEHQAATELQLLKLKPLNRNILVAKERLADLLRHGILRAQTQSTATSRCVCLVSPRVKLCMAHVPQGHLENTGCHCRAPMPERGSSLSSLQNAGLDLHVDGLNSRPQLGTRRLTGAKYPGACV